ncbi:MAG: glycogen synthase [Rhodothermia bacterium]|nr:MAG: glycogen synthase [Rhodothermia bacterium]
MKICFATSECVPFVKIGGLGDVSGALPRYLSKLGHEVKVFIPLYSTIDRTSHHLSPSIELSELSVELDGRSERFSVWSGKLPGSDVDALFIHSPTYYDRPQIYTDDEDEDERYLLFQLAIFSVLEEIHWEPDIIHANDWPTALLPVLLNLRFRPKPTFTRTASVLTIHNIGYQGTFHLSTVSKIDLPEIPVTPSDPFEYWGQFSFLKAGICFADVVSTVSPTYAKEIQTNELGRGLEGVIQSRGNRIRGVLNGIEDGIWDPSTDTLIPFQYSADRLEQKSGNKRALLEHFRLPTDDRLPLVGIISRLTEQKGFSLLEPILDQVLEEGNVRIVVLGSGDPHVEKLFLSAATLYPNQIGVHVGPDESLSHLIEAGADMFLMPSLYEPCGLNQMYSLKYGTVPVVRSTGGLADTVIDINQNPSTGNGFSFDRAEPSELQNAIQRAVSRYDDRFAWRVMQKRGMASNFSWKASAESYLDLYKDAIGASKSPVKRNPTG